MSRDPRGSTRAARRASVGKRPKGGPRPGERNGRAKLSWPLVRELRRRKLKDPGLEAIDAVLWLQERHSVEVSPSALYLIWSGKTWREEAR